jgi:hypothetical protein
MPFPNFDYCIICDLIRPEMAGKVAILGYYGMTPHVDILILNSSIPTQISLLCGFAPIRDADRYESVTVISRPDGTAIFQSPPMLLNISPTGRGLFGMGFAIPPNSPFGRYSIRIVVNGEAKLDTSFNVRQATQAELANMGFAPAPVSSRAN